MILKDENKKQLIVIAALLVLLLAGVLVLVFALSRPHYDAKTDSSGTYASPDVTVTYESGETQLDTVRDEVKLFTNRSYLLRHVPPELVGTLFTRRPGGKPADATIDIPPGATVYILVNSDAHKDTVQQNHTLLAQGWTRLADADYAGGKFALGVYKQTFASRQHLTLKSIGFTGMIVAARNLKTADHQ